MHIVKLLFLTALVSLLAACAYKTQPVPNPSTARLLIPGQEGSPRTIQIFFDGTSNDWLARTNVRRRFEIAAAAESPFAPCLYVEGVGVNTLSGKVLGTGIKNRVLKGYQFLAKNWSPGRKDKIYLYGFSRGAFQARVLAGMMAHCGLPDAQASGLTDNQLEALSEQVWDFCRVTLKDPVGTSLSTPAWKAHLKKNQEATQKRFPKVRFSNPSIQMMAIWDTVPGLPFTQMAELEAPSEYDEQRYKVRPYPNLELVMHALALDDRRSRFAPLLVGPPLDPATKVYEVWFPGAHSDVGGGYDDSNDMAGLSLHWMHELMLERGLTQRIQGFYRDAQGILHHPEKSTAMKLVNKDQRRLLPHGSTVDFSVFRRADGRPHPEEGHPDGVVYAPEIEVILPRETDTDPTTVRTKKLKLAGPYTQASAAEALQSVGLKLYNPDSTRTQSTGTVPLAPSQMKVLLKPVDLSADAGGAADAPAPQEVGAP